MIIHYVQPHSPLIGKKKLFTGKEREDFLSWRNLAYSDEIDIEEVKKAYIENLKLVLNYVKRLAKKIEGKVAVTADHGESFGEYGIYGHCPGLYTRQLLEVPWFELER